MTLSAMTIETWLTLFGAFGGAIALMYLLRLRRRRIEVPFSPLWQKVVSDSQTTSFFRVLRNLLSLLLQLLVLALVLMAIADPKWNGDSQLAEASVRTVEPAHTLLVVDTSASMGATDGPGAKPRLVAAREAAEKVIATLPPGEAVMVASMGRDMSVLTDWTTDRAALRDAIAALVVRDTNTDLEPVLTFAETALHGLESPKVVVVTDRAFTPPDPQRAAALGLRVIPVGPDKATSNLAILEFSVRSHLGNQLRYALHYRLLNASTRRQTVDVTLFTDPSGRARSRANFLSLTPARAPFVHTLEPGEERSFDQLDIDLDGSRAAIFVQASGPGDHAVDAFADDDVAFAVVPERRTVRVQLIGPDNLFLMAALSTRRGVAVEHKGLPEFTSTEGYDLTVFSKVAPATLPTGNVVFVDVATGALPCGVGKPVATPGALLVPNGVKDHPVMSFVKFVDLEVPRLTPLEKRRGQEVLSRTKAGAAAIIAGSTPERRFVAVGFDPIDSEWVGHYSFSIFFVNIVNWVFREESGYLRSQTLVEPWRVALPWHSGLAAVTRPDGTVVESLVDGAGGLAYTGDQVGIYEVRPKGAASDVRPVLVPATLGSRDESQLSPRGDYAYWVTPLTEDAPLPDLSILGLQPWRLLALVAAALLLLEWFTYHRRWTV